MNSLRAILKKREMTSFLCLILLFIVVGCINPAFFTVGNISACFNSSVLRRYMEEDKRIDWETFVKSQLHWIRVVYKIVGSQENLQEIYNLYEEFADKKRPAMEDDEEPGWEGNVILALGIDYGDCNLCGNILHCDLKDGVLKMEAKEVAFITDFKILVENHYKDLKVYFITEDNEDDIYTTNDAYRKYFHGLHSGYIVVP